MTHSSKIAFVLICLSVAFAWGETRVGVAAVDVTPDYPIRLNGFAFRRTESEGVTHRIHAKALAIDDGSNGPAVLLAVDNLGVPDYMTTEVAARLKSKAKLDPSRFAVTATHTHTAPMLTNCCPTIFGMPLTDDEQKHIDQYTHELTDKIEQVALAAIADLKPGRLEFGTGTVTFSINRRTQGGPVDHDLPVMTVRDPHGKLRAVYLSYACHCVTLSHNKISGDWAGYAAAMIEAAHPGVIALTSVGCGADSNPSSNPVGDKVEIAEQQAKEIAEEVERLLKQDLSPISKPVETKLDRITIPFDTLPTREQWEKVAKQQDPAGYHARVNLARLDRGEKLQTELSYPIQTWTFGDELAMVFLPGEVVVDYSIRLKRELDRNRLWINAYANDVPCYIPSERILKEGGYEGAGAMIYYDRPTKLATGIEQKIIDEVRAQLPDTFDVPKGTEGVAPRSPQQSLRSIRTKPGLEVELVASEPLVQSPVAIDWDAQGRLWVCEMFDYPTGTDQNFLPGGRVKLLSDTDRDGKFDKADVVIDKIPFPTGITCWGEGALVCAAPDILHVTADGRVKILFSGYATENYQARVNSLSLGLDNWLYAANGLLGGVITGEQTKLDIRNHDFRFRPITGPMETVTGLTQQGRVRDDWGNWFGCDNSRALLNYPYEERYLRRNPHAPSPVTTLVPPGNFDLSRVYPISRTLERFNDPNNTNRVTSGCGLGLYRDTLLGNEYAGNAFICEPVHNLVHRMVLDGEAAAITRHRAPDEQQSEFFASTDNWSRFVQARTGPDGALYVVDMYRFLIEHPRWIPAERLAQLDVRAGSDKGRIYRVVAQGKPLRSVPDLTRITPEERVKAFDTANGTERDRVHTDMLARPKQVANESLVALAKNATLPQVRVQALAALDGIGALDSIALELALRDSDPHVRAQALRLSEKSPGEAMLALADDPSPLVRRQLAYSLGEWDDPRAGAMLAKLATSALNDNEMRVAVLSSTSRCSGEILAAVMSADESAPGRDKWVPALVATAAGSNDDALVARAIEAVLPRDGKAYGALQFTSLASLIDARPDLREGEPRMGEANTAARTVAGEAQTAEPTRIAAIALLGRSTLKSTDLDLLADLVADESSDALREAAMSALRRQTSDEVASHLLARWAKFSPALRPDVVNLLLGRDAWSIALLETARKRRIQPNEISLADRAKLTASTSETVRNLAGEVFASQPLSATRADAMKKFESVKSLTGAAPNGKELFTKNCSACHAINGVGHEVGANLATLRGRDTDYFIKNILDPSSVVEPRFVNYVIALKDGRTLSGIIRAESTASVTLASGGSTATAVEVLPRSDIKSIRATSISMMPDGFEAAFTPQQMADLIAFLRSGVVPGKQLPGNTPETIAARNGQAILPASRAEIVGDQITFESEFKNVGYWQGQGDSVAWTLRLDKGGDYDVHLDYACADESAGNAFAIEAGGKTITGVVAGTGADWSHYKQIKLGTLHLEAGEQRLVVRPDAPPRSAVMDLRTVVVVPVGAAPRWPVLAVADTPSDGLLRDPPSIARFVLDPSHSSAARAAAIASNPQFAADLIVEMTRDLTAGTKEEYVRIPWIWRVAIAAGKRNDTGQIKRILDVSLPKDDQPLHDWQSVVIGGGIINGVSQRDVWPGPRIVEIIGDDAALLKRWERSLDLASTMADNEKVPNGTRYDALRMLGVEPWSKRGQQLARYLAKDTNAELQMGAVSGLADVDAPEAADALRKALPDLTESNRKLAEEALARFEARATKQ